MAEFLQLLATYNIGTVLIIAILTMVGIYKIIVWCKKTWAQRQAFAQENINKGVEIQRNKDKEFEAKQDEEARLQRLEKAIESLVRVNESQQRQIALLIESDQLNIKTWIKDQHEKWMALGAIDNWSLDLLELRFSIYEKEGGNSWARRLMDDIRGLPLITVVPIHPEN